MANTEDLEDEHEALKRQVDELQREHEELRKRPHDAADHAEHRRKLEVKITELRAHMARLKSTTGT